MPHQCVRCNTLYDDGAKEILGGCKCGGKLFFYIKREKLEAAKKVTVKLSRNEKKQIEKDVLDIVGADRKEEEPVVLDFESIRIVKPGKYELDVVNLFKKHPVIYKLDDGKYVIDLPTSFKKFREAS
ncbi:MAG: Zn-ribbon containing protein [archaeon]